MVAKMTEHLDVQPGDRILEIGTGSGYQAAILAWLGAARHLARAPGRAHPDARRRASTALDLAGSVEIREADGSLGDPAGAPWDGIIVTAAAPSIPDALREQLGEGGRLVIPVGSRDRQLLTIVTRHGNEWLERDRRLLRLRPAHRRRRLRGLTTDDPPVRLGILARP